MRWEMLLGRPLVVYNRGNASRIGRLATCRGAPRNKTVDPSPHKDLGSVVTGPFGPGDRQRSADEPRGLTVDTLLRYFKRIGHFVVDENNPYKSPFTGHAQDASSQTPAALKPKRVFMYSYCTSLAVAFTVVVIWLVPQSLRRTSPPNIDILQSIFLVGTTLPSVVTCLLFSVCYCAVFRIPEERMMWPAVLVGAISGLVFNAMTAIWVIEYFFKW